MPPRKPDRSDLSSCLLLYLFRFPNSLHPHFYLYNDLGFSLIFISCSWSRRNFTRPNMSNTKERYPLLYSLSQGQSQFPLFCFWILISFVLECRWIWLLKLTKLVKILCLVISSSVSHRTRLSLSQFLQGRILSFCLVVILFGSIVHCFSSLEKRLVQLMVLWSWLMSPHGLLIPLMELRTSFTGASLLICSVVIESHLLFIKSQ